MWSFHRIAIVHIESVMYISYYRQHPAYWGGGGALIVCHIFYVIGRYYIICYTSTLILSSTIMHQYVSFCGG